MFIWTCNWFLFTEGFQWLKQLDVIYLSINISEFAGCAGPVRFSCPGPQISASPNHSPLFLSLPGSKGRRANIWDVFGPTTFKPRPPAGLLPSSGSDAAAVYTSTCKNTQDNKNTLILWCKISAYCNTWCPSAIFRHNLCKKKKKKYKNVANKTFHDKIKCKLLVGSSVIAGFKGFGSSSCQRLKVRWTLSPALTLTSCVSCWDSGVPTVTAYVPGETSMKKSSCDDDEWRWEGSDTVG